MTLWCFGLDITMKHVPLALLLTGAVLMFIHNKDEQPATTNSNSRALIREHVIDLPEDGLKWETIIVSDNKTEQEQTLVSAFSTDPRLISLTEQTKFYILPSNHWWVRSRMPNQPHPMVVVQRPKPDNAGATRVYHVTGANIPISSNVLAAEIQWAIDAAPVMAPCCPGEPVPVPVPAPVPAPVPQPTPVLEDIRPKGPIVADKNLGYILIAAAGVAGAYMGYRGGRS
jgi:hypothetical protein